MPIFNLVASFLLFTALSCTTLNKSKNITYSLQDITLTDLDGNNFKLIEMIKYHPATVLIWWASKCPCVKRYQKRVDEIYEKYSAKNILVFNVSSNVDESLIKIKDLKKTRAIITPILIDPHSKLAKFLEVNSTPSVVVLDYNGKVIFKGWLDNETAVGKKTRVAFLENALNEILEGKNVSAPESAFYGCKITKPLRKDY